jgi:hypothetical protein
MRKRPLRSNRIPILTLPRENKSGDNMPSLLGLRGFARPLIGLIAVQSTTPARKIVD